MVQCLSIYRSHKKYVKTMEAVNSHNSEMEVIECMWIEKLTRWKFDFNTFSQINV